MGIYLTSDLHLGHDKDFIYKPRGFNSVDEANESIISNWNSIINEDDLIYVLGDLTLGDIETNIKLIEQLKGKLFVIVGNHDTDNRLNYYSTCHNIIDIQYAYRIKYRKKLFWLSHYPTNTSNDYSVSDSNNKIDTTIKNRIRKEPTVWNLHGHTHSNEVFQSDLSYGHYNVALDAHDNKPVNIETIIDDIKVREFYR